MFVRWKQQPRKNSILWSAELVESVRIDGKPRQRVAAYLGSIDEAKLDDVVARARFWRSVYRHISDYHPIELRHHHEWGAPTSTARRNLDIIRETANSFDVVYPRVLEPGERAKIEAKLAERVPLPSEDERRRYEAPTIAERESARLAAVERNRKKAQARRERDQERLTVER